MTIEEQLKKVLPGFAWHVIPEIEEWHRSKLRELGEEIGSHVKWHDKASPYVKSSLQANIDAAISRATGEEAN